ncbi:MAG: hypothetical protein WC821_04285 [archaeon]|jgi:hypothetical protein
MDDFGQKLTNIPSQNSFEPRDYLFNVNSSIEVGKIFSDKTIKEIKKTFDLK